MLTSVAMFGGPIEAVASEVQLRLSRRDDVQDARYVELGREYQALGVLMVGSRTCTGVLVTTRDGARKVLTAAHCFDRNFDDVSEIDPETVVFQTGPSQEGARAVGTAVHLQAWGGEPGLDLAILELGPFTNGDGPIPMVASRENPAGKAVTMVGYGTHGTGAPPFENNVDSRRRAATNVADAVMVSGENVGQIWTDFDHPSDTAFSTLGDSVPTPMEGTSGTGDSGGPLIAGGRVVGILHGGSNPTDLGFSEYGDVSIYAGIFHEPNTAFLREQGVVVTGLGEGPESGSVHVGAPGPVAVTHSDGQVVGTHAVLRVGTLPAAFDLNAATLDDVAREWIPFGEVTKDQAEVFGSGSLLGDVADFAGHKIFWWLLDSVGEGPSPDLSNVSAWGLFSSNEASWVFPDVGSELTPILSWEAANESFGGGQIDSERFELVAVDGFELEYSVWAESAFPSSVPDSDREIEADPDGDEVPNGVEWAQGTSPVIGFREPPFVLRPDEDGTVSLSYDKLRSLPSGVVSIEFSPNLIHWSVRAPLATSSVIIDGQRERIEHQFRVGGAEGREAKLGYWRLRVVSGESVEQPPDEGPVGGGVDGRD